MSMSMHDRYYEPEDSDNDDMDEYVSDWVRFEMREGGYCDPTEQHNFGEAVGELGLNEELESYDKCSEAEKAQIKAYWYDVAVQLAEESYYERNY